MLRPISLMLMLEIVACVAPDAPAPAPDTTSALSIDKSGKPAPPHLRFPHAVLFARMCGGSVIHARWVLTAAHCTIAGRGREVLAGTSFIDDGSGQTVLVKKLHIHPLFTIGPYWLDPREYGIKQVAARWDFMLIELAEPLTLDGVNIRAVALDRGPVPDVLPVGYGGFGASTHDGLISPFMHAMMLKTVSHERCATLQEYDNRVMLCADGMTEKLGSACKGDSGSGLVSQDRDELVGVLSWIEDDALECGPGKLVVFSRVAAAVPWIMNVTGFTYNN